MAEEFSHFVITRFNVRFARSQVARPSSEWLDRRLDLFSRTAVPSLNSQTSKRFRWLVFFQDDVSDDFRQRVEGLASRAHFEPVWINEFFDGELVSRCIAPLTDSDFIITSRVDNDDALSRDYIQAVQSRFARQDLLYLNFVRGIQIVPGGQVYRYDANSNPFVSLIERIPQGGVPATVFHMKHTQIRKHADILQIIDAPMWAQVIHDGNMMNGIRGPVTRKAVVAENFSIDVDLGSDASFLRKIKSAFWELPLFWIRNTWFAKEWLRTRVDLARGTHVKPRTSSTLT
ncbi:MAG: glycosyltransferase [Microbacterium sp.]|uniref:glycosyltransferase n=1 Tax=Microbacterium sp. TaxID=51671 RepID=UPI0039E4FF35